MSTLAPLCASCIAWDTNGVDWHPTQSQQLPTCTQDYSAASAAIATGGTWVMACAVGHVGKCVGALLRWS
jgi:hypothetical protein